MGATKPISPDLSRGEFLGLARAHADETVAIPLGVRLLADQLTPVVAYRRLVSDDPRTSPSFLLESVEGGERQGRYSIMGAQPTADVIATGPHAVVTGGSGHVVNAQRSVNPLLLPRELSRHVRLVAPEGAVERGELPACFLGGWVGYAGYDTVRYAEPEKLASPPRDDRGLPDLDFAFYDGVVVFDHVAKVVYVVQLALVGRGLGGGAAVDAHRAYDEASAKLAARVAQIQRFDARPLPSGRVERALAAPAPLRSNIGRDEHRGMVARALEYIRAGDIFQVVIGQRFERRSGADPFDVYRALRTVNPSPYMVYMQARGCILVASSPEILCRVRATPGGLVVTNRPLAGTRRRGATPEEDARLERELLADAKERAEHVMLVDLGRNDVGRVARPGSIDLPAVMEVERYSHVMHISSTVTGTLRPGLDCWDALVAALPVGTISGAPKVRAMQIIDELEPVRRGPYGGGMGYVGLDGQMDIALALRTMVVPTAQRDGRTWMYHLQAAGGIVADSNPDDEFQETVNKAAALARAIEVAERAFVGPGTRDDPARSS
ncbi:MAG: anthranilate synthase component I [Phycisphaerae bacterium]|nr:anthranilate synthase component I [Phycisphaerae bacterium]